MSGISAGATEILGVSVGDVEALGVSLGATEIWAAGPVIHTLELVGTWTAGANVASFNLADIPGWTAGDWAFVFLSSSSSGSASRVTPNGFFPLFRTRTAAGTVLMVRKLDGSEGVIATLTNSRVHVVIVRETPKRGKLRVDALQSLLVADGDYLAPWNEAVSLDAASPAVPGLHLGIATGADTFANLFPTIDSLGIMQQSFLASSRHRRFAWALYGEEDAVPAWEFGPGSASQQARLANFTAVAAALCTFAPPTTLAFSVTAGNSGGLVGFLGSTNGTGDPIFGSISKQPWGPDGALLTQCYTSGGTLFVRVYEQFAWYMQGYEVWIDGVLIGGGTWTEPSNTTQLAVATGFSFVDGQTYDVELRFNG